MVILSLGDKLIQTKKYRSKSVFYIPSSWYKINNYLLRTDNVNICKVILQFRAHTFKVLLLNEVCDFSESVFCQRQSVSFLETEFSRIN